MSFTDKFEKEDYYLSEDGFIVFTEKYHLKARLLLSKQLPPLSVEG